MSLASEPTPASVPRNADPRLRPAHPRGVRLTTLILAGVLSAALFGSRVLLQEIQSEPDMMGFEALKKTAMIWDRAMRHVRAAVPDAALHDAVRRAEAARF